MRFIDAQPRKRVCSEMFLRFTSTNPAASFQPGDHHFRDRRFQKSLGFGQGVIQAGAFFQFRFVQRRSIDNKLSGGTTFGAHGFNLKCGLRYSADR